MLRKFSNPRSLVSISIDPGFIDLEGIMTVTVPSSEMPDIFVVKVGGRRVEIALSLIDIDGVQAFQFQTRFSTRCGFKYLSCWVRYRSGVEVFFGRRLIYVRNRDVSGLVRFPSAQAPLDYGLNVVGLFRFEHGIAEGARATLRSLQSVDFPFLVVDAPFNANCSDSNREFCQSTLPYLNYRFNLFHFNAPNMSSVRNAWPEMFEHNYYNIGYWAWELCELPDSWMAGQKGLNEIWVPSNFVKQAVEAKLDIPVCVVPHAIDLIIPVSCSHEEFSLPNDQFLILCVFDFNSYVDRKNPWAVIEAFRIAREFSYSIHLVIKVSNASHHWQRYTELLRVVDEIGSVSVIDEFLSRAAMTRLQLICDAFISLHRSEGFGLNLAECMFLGKPVIATGWSGNCEFMDMDNSCLVAYDLVEIEEDVGPYQAGQLWADADVDDAARQLLDLVRDPKRCAEIGKLARESILSSLSPSSVGTRVSNRLNVLSGEK